MTLDGDTEMASFDHTNFAAIREHVLAGEFDEAMSLMNVAIGIQNWGQGSLQIEDGKILYMGMELTGKLVDRIIVMMVDGDNAFERFAKFLNKAMEQQSFTTRARIMDFTAARQNNGPLVAHRPTVSADFTPASATTKLSV